MNEPEPWYHRRSRRRRAIALCIVLVMVFSPLLFRIAAAMQAAAIHHAASPFH